MSLRFINQIRVVFIFSLGWARESNELDTAESPISINGRLIIAFSVLGGPSSQMRAGLETGVNLFFV